MSAAGVDAILKDRGFSQALEEFVVSVAFTRSGVAAFALGDGTLRLVTAAGEWTTVAAHAGGILGMAAAGDAVVTGGDDGRLCRTEADGATREVASFGSKWVEQVAGWSDGKAGLMACSVGKAVHLFDGAGQALKTLPHPATVAGIAFDAKGKRVAAAHYGGATLWFVGREGGQPAAAGMEGQPYRRRDPPRQRGGGDRHAGERAARLAPGGWPAHAHERLPGQDGEHELLAQRQVAGDLGAESIVMWPFFGGGPMGKAPTELAGGDDVQCTRVAFHPQSEMVAAGFSDGLVVVADVASQRILPIAKPGHGPVSGLAWSPDGTRLAFGTEQGLPR